MSPIATFIQLAGEPATIFTPVTQPAYDPTSGTDWQPASPTQYDVVGVDGRGKKMVEGMPAGATGAFTIEAYALPDGLQPMQSKLQWAGTLYTIHSVRERRWLGAIDGYTLFLAA